MTSSEVAPGQANADGDGGGIGFGEKIDAEVAKREDAEHDQKTDQHYGKDRSLNACFSKCHDSTPQEQLLPRPPWPLTPWHLTPWPLTWAPDPCLLNALYSCAVFQFLRP